MLRKVFERSFSHGRWVVLMLSKGNKGNGCCSLLVAQDIHAPEVGSSNANDNDRKRKVLVNAQLSLSLFNVINHSISYD
jgi:hypothetical protein